MSGSISLSLDQLLNSLGTPLSGGKIYFYAAGTTTPQSAYQDSDLTILHANPLVLNSVGYVPQFYLADGFIKIRVTDSNGVEQLAADNILVVGPSSGSGGVSVDATTVFSTGDVKWRYGTGVHSGWVRFAGRTIGSATSGATERANADTQTLFEYLWTADANLSVSTGRGLSAAADWAANKTLTLPDARGRTVAALGDMGNSDAARMTATYFGAAGTTLGAVGGSESQTLTTAQLASHSHTITDVTHSHTASNQTAYAGNTTASGATASAYTAIAGGPLDLAGITTGTSLSGISGTNSAGSGSAHNNTQPTILMTLYGKL